MTHRHEQVGGSVELAYRFRLRHTEDMEITDISEAKADLSKLIERVQTGEEVVIGKAGKPVAMLVPYPRESGPRQLGGSWEGHVQMADDFDELPEELLKAFNRTT